MTLGGRLDTLTLRPAGPVSRSARVRHLRRTPSLGFSACRRCHRLRAAQRSLTTEQRTINASAGERPSLSSGRRSNHTIVSPVYLIPVTQPIVSSGSRVWRCNQSHRPSHPTVSAEGQERRCSNSKPAVHVRGLFHLADRDGGSSIDAVVNFALVAALMAVQILTESLILAQDERWRRA